MDKSEILNNAVQNVNQNVNSIGKSVKIGMGVTGAITLAILIEEIARRFGKKQERKSLVEKGIISEEVYNAL